MTKTRSSTRKLQVNEAATWATLWERLAPADMRQLPTRHAQSGGELRFAVKHLKRRWAFDWCIEPLRIACEVDGGKQMVRWSPRLKRHVVVGRHNKDEDLRKHNAATMFGWLVFHFSPDMLRDEPLKCIEAVAQAVRVRRRENEG